LVALSGINFPVHSRKRRSLTGHYGTGDVEITLSKAEDLEKAKPLIQRSYEAS
jgi:predicted transport protein